MFENIIKFFKKKNKEDKKATNSKSAAKERLHLVLMQDRANVSADFLELMKQEIIEVIKKYIEVDEEAIDVRLTNQTKDDGTNGAPALYANIPIMNIKNETRKNNSENENDKDDKKEEKKNENKDEIKKDDKNSSKKVEKPKEEAKKTDKKEEKNSADKKDNKKESSKEDKQEDKENKDDENSEKEVEVKNK